MISASEESVPTAQQRNVQTFPVLKAAVLNAWTQRTASVLYKTVNAPGPRLKKTAPTATPARRTMPAITACVAVLISPNAMMETPVPPIAVILKPVVFSNPMTLPAMTDWTARRMISALEDRVLEPPTPVTMETPVQTIYALKTMDAPPRLYAM